MKKIIGSWKKIILVILGIIVVGTLWFDLYMFSPSSLKELYNSERASETDEDDSLISVGFCQVGSESVWRTANTNSIQNNLTEENGFFLRFANARQKQENQIKTIREYISQKVDYIVLAPATEYGWETVLSEAKEAGIPVIIVDRMVEVKDQDLYTAFVGTNMYDEGRKAGEWLEEYCEEKNITQDLNIVILTGTEGSTAEIGRTKGFANVAKRHREWKILESRDGDFTTTKGKEIMEDYIKKYKNIDVVISQNDDMTFGVIEALDEAGITHGTNGRVKVISYDGSRQALRMLRDGYINADVECNPLQGEYIADIIKAHKNGEPIEKINYIEEKLFTIYNVNGYISSRTY